jgi:D-alanyl-D-alanine carboxypeptidase (penicillin-binding protein 5/6)
MFTSVLPAVRRLRRSLFVAGLGLLGLVGGAPAQPLAPPQVGARHFVLLDLTAGQTLAERDADTPTDPASLTKLMTAYLVFGALREGRIALTQRVPVSQRAWDERRGTPSLMFIDPTMTPTVDELLHGMIVQSGNDASVALAEAVAGSVETFVATMNRQAQAWGLRQTAFANVTGMSQPGHRSSARDIATIATRLIQDFPEFYHYYSVREFTFNQIRQDNRNLLLRRDPSVDGLKTGFTSAAGFCLVASAVREFPNLGPEGRSPGPRRLLSVVIGSASLQSRADESQRLLNWGFGAFDAIKLFDGGRAIATPAVWQGRQRSAALGLARDLVLSVPRGEADRLQTAVERTDPLIAPLAAGQRVGTLRVTTRAGAPVAEVPLVVLEPVAQAGFLRRAWDALRLWIR